MHSFKSYFENNILSETLSSDVDIHTDKELSRVININFRDKIFTGHTVVFYSKLMKNNDYYILRLMNKKKEIEYHFIDHKGHVIDDIFNKKALSHALMIIYKDSKSYLDRGNTIKLQGSTVKHANEYKKFAHDLLQKHGLSGKIVKDKGETERLDGLGTAHTILIEQPTHETINWFDMIYT